MDKSGDKPDRKTCAKDNPQGQLPVKANKSCEEKQDTRHNAPQGCFGVIGHQVEIFRIVRVQPEQYDKTCQRHNGNQARQCWQLTAYLRAENDNTYTNQQLDKESHTLTCVAQPLLCCRRQFLLDEPDSQRITIGLAVVCLDRGNKQKD